MATPYRLLGITILPLLRWRITKVEGLEHLPQGGFVAVANHQSWIDSAIVGAALYKNISKSIRFIAQSSKYRFLGGIPIKEYDKRKVLDVAAGYLEAGHPIVIFPGGNSSADASLHTGKTGAIRLAMLSGGPIVPIGIRGTSGVKLWQAVWWFIRWWRECTVTIGQPMQIEQRDLSTTSHEELGARTEEIMQHLSVLSGKPYDQKEVAKRDQTSWVEKVVWKFLLPIWRYRIKVTGAEHLPTAGPYIVAGNHQSFVDPPALAIAVMKKRGIQPAFLAKAGVVKVFEQLVGKKGTKALGMLMVDTKDRGSILHTAVEHLRAGGVIGIFPEGTRNSPKKNAAWRAQLLKGKTGTARLVLATGVPVIPTGIDMQSGHGLVHVAWMTLKFWKRIPVQFGPPIQFQVHPVSAEAVTKEELDSMTADIMNGIGRVSGKIYHW